MCCLCLGQVFFKYFLRVLICKVRINACLSKGVWGLKNVIYLTVHCRTICKYKAVFIFLQHVGGERDASKVIKHL